MKTEEKKSGVYKNLLTGGCSAAFARTLTNPIERLEILKQVQNNEYKGLNFINSMIKFYKTQGINGLFKGNSASVARIFPFSSIEFYSFEKYKNIVLRGKPKDNSYTFKVFIGGALAGLNAITLTYPLDVSRSILAVQTSQSEKRVSLVEVLVNLFKKDRIKGLYRGYPIVFFGSIPFVAFKQTIFDYLKFNYMVERYRNTLNYIYGSLSGVIGTTILYPTYLLKRVVQTSNIEMNYTNHIKKIYVLSGIAGFYKGLLTCYLKVIPYQGFLFWSNEKFKKFIKYE